LRERVTDAGSQGIVARFQTTATTKGHGGRELAGKSKRGKGSTEATVIDHSYL
jgi:hypothetical protein